MSDAPPQPRPVVFVQVDLDSLWAVRSVYGLPVHQSHIDDDPLYRLAIPRFLELFASRGVKATFFAIGRDAEVPQKSDLLRMARRDGHEIANHSYSHPLGLGARPHETIREEILRAQHAIAQAVGQAPVGFRSPGYDASPPVLQAVREAGLAYDSSVLPTPVGPILRFVSNRLKRGGARSPAGHYGAGPVWRAPRTPYRADCARPWTPAVQTDQALLELPLSVSPVLGLPIHASIAMIAGLPAALRAIRQIKARKRVLVYAFHGIDLVGGDELPELPRGWLASRVLGLPAHAKRRFVSAVLDQIAQAARSCPSCDAIHIFA